MPDDGSSPRREPRLAYGRQIETIERIVREAIVRNGIARLDEDKSF